MRLFYSIATLAVLLPAAARAQQPTAADSIAHRSRGKAVSRAKITEDSARKVALARIPNGVVKSAELEHEQKKLVYSFDITVPGKDGAEEVLVNALNGHVVSIKHESAKAEQAEQRKEEQERQKKGKGLSKDSTRKSSPSRLPTLP